MKSSTNVRHLALGGLIAAVYVILSVGLAPISYGPVQLRVAEALTILAVLSPVAIPGLTVGCLLANLVGVYLGMTLPLDVVIGTLATFLAAVASYGLRRFTLGADAGFIQRGDRGLGAVVLFHRGPHPGHLFAQRLLGGHRGADCRHGVGHDPL